MNGRRIFFITKSQRRMWPDRGSNQRPLDSQSDSLPTALGGPTMSNRRSIITTRLKLFRISMLSNEPALSTVAVKPKIVAFKTPSNNGKCYYWYCILRWLTWQLYLSSRCDQQIHVKTLWVRRLVWVFSGSTSHFVGFAVHRLIYRCGARRLSAVCWDTSFTKDG